MHRHPLRRTFSRLSIGVICSALIASWLSITPANAAGMTLVDDTFGMAPGAAVEGNVLANDSGASAPVRLGLNPSHGTLTWNGDGTFRYVPDAGYTGTDTFTYWVSDPDVAIPSTCTAGSGTSIESGLTGIAGAPLQDRTPPVNLVDNGDFSRGADGTFWGLTTNQNSYKALPGWSSYGGGSLTYAWWGKREYPDADGGASPEKVYFGNSLWNIPLPSFDGNGFTQTSPSSFTSLFPGYNETGKPVTIEQSVATTVGVRYRLQFFQSAEWPEKNPSVAALRIGGYNRTYFRVGPGIRRITLDFVAKSTSTTIAFENWGHAGGSSSSELALDDVIINDCTPRRSATVTVRPYEAVNDTYTTPYETPVSGDVKAKDFYPSGSTFTQTSDPANGTVSWNSDGTYTYTPNDGFTGVDTFTYQLCLPSPNEATCLAATETIVVAPDAVDDSYVTPVNTPISTTATPEDTYPSGATFALTEGSVPVDGNGVVQGTVTFNADGSYTYTPPTNYVGTVTFSYKVCLPAPYGNVCDTATETITIKLEAVDDYYETPYFTAMTTGDVKTGDSIPSDAYIEKTSDPLHGTVTWNADGTFTYMPDEYWFGTDSFTYLVCTADRTICDTATEYIVVPRPTSYISHTIETCSSIFLKPTLPLALKTIQYAAKSGKVSQVNPGVFFYWAKVTVPGTGVAVSQSNSPSWPYWFAQSAGTQLFDLKCSPVKGTSVATNGSGVTTISGAKAGTYYLAVKYGATSLVGKPQPPTSPIAYTFTSGMGAQPAFVNFTRK